MGGTLRLLPGVGWAGCCVAASPAAYSPPSRPNLRTVSSPPTLHTAPTGSLHGNGAHTKRRSALSSRAPASRWYDAAKELLGQVERPRCERLAVARGGAGRAVHTQGLSGVVWAGAWVLGRRAGLACQVRPCWCASARQVAGSGGAATERNPTFGTPSLPASARWGCSSGASFDRHAPNGCPSWESAMCLGGSARGSETVHLPDPYANTALSSLVLPAVQAGERRTCHRCGRCAFNAARRTEY